jgi:hypothetical protein
VEPLPEDGAGAAATEETVSTLEAPEAPAAATIAETVPLQAAQRSTAAASRHITRDYSYVRAEVKRIGLVAGFLIVSLMITAILRN